MAKRSNSAADSADHDVDRLFQLPLSEFTAARNALANGLKKEGHSDAAARVKTLAKPSISAWVANQLYWRHQQAFERLLSAGDRFREAQAAQLAGRAADVRAPLDERREALADLARLASEILRDAGHPASPDTMRRIMTTLEAVATYGEQAGAPHAGRLTADADPPGFEALAALLPHEGGRRGDHGRSRVIPFSPPKPERAKRRPARTDADAEAETRRRRAEAHAALREAERTLADARKAAERARSAMRHAAARAKAAETAKAQLESRLEKLGVAAEDTRQKARRMAAQAEDAEQAIADAERAVTNAKAALKDDR